MNDAVAPAAKPLRYLCFLLVALIPLRNIVEKVPNFGLEGLNITNLLFALVYIFALLDRRKGDQSVWRQPLSVPIVLFVLLSFAMIFVTDQSIINLSEMFKFWKDMALNMSLYMIAIKAFRTRRDIIVCLIIMGLANIYMDVYFWRWVRWTEFAGYADKLKSVNGTFGSVGGPNEWAAFFSTYTFLTLSLADNLKERRIRLSLYLLSLANVLVMLYTFSRGAYIAFGVGLVLYSIMCRKWRWAAILGVVAVAYSLVLPTSVVERIDMSFQQSEEGSIQDQDIGSRLRMWEYSVDKIGESPIIGNGFMSFAFEGFRNPHNQHLNVLYQFGVLGYLLFCLIFLRSFRAARAIWMKNKGDDFVRAIGQGLVAVTVSLFSSNLFGDRWIYLPVTGYFWVLNGLGMALLWVEAQERKERTAF